MDDDTRRAMSILAKAVFKLRSDEDLDEAHATELRALAWPPQPPAPTTVDVLGSDLRVGDVVVMVQEYFGVWHEPLCGDMVITTLAGYIYPRYRVRLPRPEVAPSVPPDDDPEWRDVPAERAAFKTLRVGDRWFTPSNRWITTNGLAVDPTGYQWIKRHDHPSRKRAPSVAVDPPADALPAWVDVEALAREEYAAWTEGLTSWESISSELRKAWCMAARTVALAVLRMQRDAQQTSAGSLAKASPSTSRGADGPTEPRTSTQPDVPGALARLWSAYGHAGSARAELRLVFSLLGAAPPNEDEPGMHSPRPKKHGRKI